MTGLPKMVPSAEERIGKRGGFSREQITRGLVRSLIEDAFRDGALAERERILALLRNPSKAMLEAGGDLLLDGRIEIEAAEANARGIWRAMLDAAKLGGEG